MSIYKILLTPVSSMKARQFWCPYRCSSQELVMNSTLWKLISEAQYDWKEKADLLLTFRIFVLHCIKYHLILWNLESLHVHVFLIHFFFKICLSYKFTSPCPISAHLGYVVLIFQCPNRYSPVSFLFQNERNKGWYNTVRECNNTTFVIFCKNAIY